MDFEKIILFCISNTPGVLTNTTAELALALMLATTRRIQEASIAVKEGEWGCWKPEWLLGQDIADSTVGTQRLFKII